MARRPVVGCMVESALTTVALDAYRSEYGRRQAIEQLDELRADHRTLGEFKESLDPDRLIEEAHSLLRQGDVVSARRLVATAETVDPGATEPLSPRWAVGPGSIVPSRLAGAAIRTRTGLQNRRRKEG